VSEFQQAEEAVISALLVDPSLAPVLAASLEADDFGSEAYRVAFEGILGLLAEGKRVDAVTLRSRGVDVSDIALQGAGVALSEYADIIKDGRFRRELGNALDDMHAMLRRGMSRTDILGKLASLRQGLVSNDRTTFDPDRAVEEYARIRVERRLHGVGQAYGITALDRHLQPAHGGDMIVVAARPSIGKSVLAEHIADAWAFESDFPVLFVSIEMSLAQLMDRAVSRDGNLPSASVVRGTLGDEDERRIDTTLAARQAVNLWYVDNPYATTETIRAAAAEVKLRAGGLRGIIVDYLQLLNDKGDNDNQRIGRISRSLKALAREHDVPILVLSQLNRQSEYRSDPHPRLSDIRDSGAVEQDADVVLGLHRDRGGEFDSLLEIDILKNRQGPLARINVVFDGTHVRLDTEA
jgi:replicative DNA helicase